MYTEDELLLLSGLQHFAFCHRPWALIHLEQVWTENRFTAEGEILHERAHDGCLTEKRGGLIVSRGLRIVSCSLGVTGACDVVEFHSSPEGVPLSGREGKWLPLPVEYKRGKPKAHDADELQLCGEALCLEEMLACRIPKGFLYYGETRRRLVVEFTPELRGGAGKRRARFLRRLPPQGPARPGVVVTRPDGGASGSICRPFCRNAH